MINFDISDVVGFKLQTAEKILKQQGFSKITHKIYSSSKVKTFDTLVVIKAAKQEDGVELLLGEFLFDLKN